MMTELNRDQAHALAALITALRPDWDTAGVLAKLAEARTRGDAHDVAHAALYAAQDPANRTPAVIPLAGTHWTRGRTPGTTGAPEVPGRTRCDEHPAEVAHNCRSCAAEAKAAPGVDDPPIARRVGAPIPPDARALIDAALHRTPTGGTR